MAAESDRLARRSNRRHRKTRRPSRSQATYATFRLDHSAATSAGVSAGYASYIGRVGALAVALGVGAAVATGYGIGVSTRRRPVINRDIAYHEYPRRGWRLDPALVDTTHDRANVHRPAPLGTDPQPVGARNKFQ